MGLLQKACETYNCHIRLVGLPQAGEKKETLAPVSHILTSAQIEITLNQDGKFRSAKAIDKKEPKIVIPVTEESGGRSGTDVYKRQPAALPRRKTLPQSRQHSG